MPPMIDQPNVLRCDLLTAASLDSLETTRFYFTYTGTPPSDATCSLYASDLTANWVSTLRGFYDSDHALIGARVTDLTSPSSGTGEYLQSSAGSRAGAFLPVGTAALTNYAISRRYRGGKPRNYWSVGVGADLQNDSEWTTSFQGTFQTAVQTFMSDFAGVTISGCTTGVQVNVSYYLGSTEITTGTPPYVRGRTKSTPRAVAIPPDPITSISVNILPAYQRRRAQR